MSKSEIRKGEKELKSSAVKMKCLASRRRKPGESVKGEDVSVEPERRQQTYTHWLMKSEPESRFEKGVDVKVSKQSCVRNVILESPS